MFTKSFPNDNLMQTIVSSIQNMQYFYFQVIDTYSGNDERTKMKLETEKIWLATYEPSMFRTADNQSQFFSLFWFSISFFYLSLVL